MTKARLRIHKPNSLEPNRLEPDGVVQIIIVDEEKHKVHAWLPISDFAYAVMGVSGIDCDMEITDISGRNK